MVSHTKHSIKGLAKKAIELALKRKLPLFFTTKNTILKNYDNQFKQIFDNLLDKQKNVKNFIDFKVLNNLRESFER
ncbi:AKR_collapsed_G0047320.mRNA.1.CDS.1 [Saccharomyces cerevisiae]|nr:AKR_collapsed_G0047320.mRNA.1.CDS.1 [Saccharomyces cerevisiae]